MDNLVSIHVNMLGYGGAWIAANRIGKSLNSLGHKTFVESFLDSSNSKSTHSRLLSKADYELARLANTSMTTSLFRGKLLEKWLPVLEDKYSETDIWNLHWTPGAIGSNFANFLSRKRVIWTLHDMNAFTGVCHYSADCLGYLENCQRCPQIPKLLQSVPSRVLAEKIKITSSAKNLTFVTPSKWLYNECRNSTLGQFSNTVHIPNPIPTQVFKKGRPTRVPTITILGANYRLSKNSGLSALAVLEFLAKNPNLKIRLKVIGTKLDELSHVEQILLAPSSDEMETANFLGDSDIFLYTSTKDNLPSFVLEAQAAGNVVIALDQGGVSDCFQAGVSGMAVRANSSEIAEAIRSLLTSSHRLTAMASKGREYVEKTFSYQKIGQQYASLYEEVLLGN